MLSPSPFPGNAAGLVTGLPDFDQEHRLLLSTIDRLGQISQDLDDDQEPRLSAAERAAQRHSAVVDLLGDLVSFLFDHFCKEEAFMKSTGLTLVERDVCERHKEDHAAISHTVQEIITSFGSDSTALQVRKLHQILTYWVKNHIQIHDQVLFRLLPKQP